MSIALLPVPTISSEEYLALEVESEIRNEYRNGEIVPMTGGTPADKFAAYRSIEGFEEYLLIDQAKVGVEHYVKQAENQWLFASYDRVDVQLVLTSLGAQVSLADLYSTINFE